LKFLCIELTEGNKDVTDIQDHAVMRNDLKALLQKKRWQDAVEKRVFKTLI